MDFESGRTVPTEEGNPIGRLSPSERGPGPGDGQEPRPQRVPSLSPHLVSNSLPDVWGQGSGRGLGRVGLTNWTFVGGDEASPVPLRGVHGTGRPSSQCENGTTGFGPTGRT